MQFYTTSFIYIITILAIVVLTIFQIPDLNFYDNFNETLDMVRYELPFENYTNVLPSNKKTLANTVIAATFIMYYTMLSLKSVLLEVGILFGVMSFACIAFDFSKIVCRTVVASQKTKNFDNIFEAVLLYRRILRFVTIYNEVHGFLLFIYVIDLLIFSTLSATNISTFLTIPYNGVVICIFITIYSIASFTAINVSIVPNFG